jgi:hypothetical protein
VIVPTTYQVYEGNTLLAYAAFDKYQVKLQPVKLSSDRAAKLLEELNGETLPESYRFKPTKPVEKTRREIYEYE